MSVERRPFPTGAEHAALLRLLLALDGSTTRTCEAIVQAPMQIELLCQEQVHAVPDAVHEHLGGDTWLLRVTAMHAHGQVMMDNLSFTRLDAVPPWFLTQLHEGKAPIGHMLQHVFVRREPVPSSARLEGLLWEHVGHPDLRASRSYRIVTEKKPLMMIFETFRGGLVDAQ